MSIRSRAPRSAPARPAAAEDAGAAHHDGGHRQEGEAGPGLRVAAADARGDHEAGDGGHEAAEDISREPDARRADAGEAGRLLAGSGGVAKARPAAEKQKLESRDHASARTKPRAEPRIGENRVGEGER